MAVRDSSPTYYTLLVISLLLSAHEERYWEDKIIDRLAMPAQNLYPIMQKLLSAGIIEGMREPGLQMHLGRVPRIHYRLTSKGVRYGKAYHLEQLASNPPLQTLHEFS